MVRSEQTVDEDCERTGRARDRGLALIPPSPRHPRPLSFRARPKRLNGVAVARRDEGLRSGGRICFKYPDFQEEDDKFPTRR